MGDLQTPARDGGGDMTNSERLSWYLGQTAIGALVGLAVVWFIDQGSLVNHRPGILSTNHDYRAASYIVALFAVAAVFRSAYKRHELLPLAVMYVAAVGALTGVAVGAAIVGGWTEFLGATMPINIQAGFSARWCARRRRHQSPLEIRQGP